jgi:hypothetical protein
MPNTNNISLPQKKSFEKRVKASKLPEKKQREIVDLYAEMLDLYARALADAADKRRRNR